MTARFRPRFSRLLTESLSSVTQRHSRALLSVLGVVIGIASFVSVLGVTTSANGQISREFIDEQATVLHVEATQTLADGSAFRAESEDVLAGLNGVVGVGRYWDVTADRVSRLPGAIEAEPVRPRVLAVSWRYLEMAHPVIETGRTFDGFLEHEPVALLGAKRAEALGITNLQAAPALFVNEQRFAIIGILSDSDENVTLASSVIVPAAFARDHLPPPGNREQLLIDTKVGSTVLISQQAALAIDPVHPERISVSQPAPPTRAESNINGSLQVLFLALSLICLVIGAIGISSSALFGVLTRVPEIGLRRALGAQPIHIAAQFLIEALLRGVLGGVLGGSIGVLTVVVVAITQQWTPIIPTWLMVVAPVAGAGVGLLAGVYPAVRAARIQPVEAFNRYRAGLLGTRRGPNRIAAPVVAGFGSAPPLPTA